MRSSRRKTRRVLRRFDRLTRERAVYLYAEAEPIFEALGTSTADDALAVRLRAVAAVRVLGTEALVEPTSSEGIAFLIGYALRMMQEREGDLTPPLDVANDDEWGLLEGTMSMHHASADALEPLEEFTLFSEPATTWKAVVGLSTLAIQNNVQRKAASRTDPAVDARMRAGYYARCLDERNGEGPP